MAKTLLIGPAGCGKTSRVLQEFEQTLRNAANPLERNFFFVLPSAEHTERIVSLVLQHGLKGFFYRRVTTFSRLVSELFGPGEERMLSNAARYSILSDILRKNSWEYFSEVQQTSGFLNLMVQFIAEMKESLVSVSDFRQRMNEIKKLEPDTAFKYEALAAIYEAYEERLAAEGFHDRQDSWEIYQEKKAKCEIQSKFFQKLWLDGFFDFSNLQMAFFHELADMTQDITVTLTADPARPYLFEAVASTRKALEEMGFEVQEMKSKNFRSQNSVLVFFEKNIFGESPHPSPLPKGERGNEREKKNIPLSSLGGEGRGEEALTIFESVGIQGEIEMIAREIQRLYRAGDYRYSDFAVLLRQIGNYDSVIRSVFGHYGIPVEIHERERLKLSPMIQTVVLLFEIFRQDWRRSDLINFLKSSYVRKIGKLEKSYEWVGELEHRAMREGVLRGREEWLKDWSGQGGDQGLEEFNAAKKQCLSVIGELEDAFRISQPYRRIKKLLRSAIHETFGIFQISDSLEEFVRRDAASEKRIEQILEEIERHLPEGSRTEISFEAFLDYFLRLVELDLYSLHNRDKNRVQVYDISLARQKEYRVVFLAGLLEKSFPVQIKEDPVLSDWERRLTNAGLSHLLREKLSRQNIERYLFYLAVTRASERLILTHARLDREGKESLPSLYLDEIQSLFKNSIPIQKQNLSRPYPNPAEAVNLQELETAVIGSLWNPAERENKLPLYLLNQLLSSEASRQRIQNAFYEVRAELKDPALREQDYFRAGQTSPTRLEEYGKCSYKYFAGKVLKLQDPEDEINFKQKGTILHFVLENYFRRHARQNRDFSFIRNFVAAELKIALEKFPLIAEKKYQWELDRAELEEMLLRFLQFETTRLQTSKLQPKYFEFSFDSDEEAQAPPLELENAAGKKIQLRGKIDRIDVDPDHQTGLVVDYKRSAEFKKDDLDLGIALQLPIYLAAAEKYLKLKPAGGEFYSLKEIKKKGFYHAENAAPWMKLSAQSLKLSEEEFRQVLERSFDFIKRFSEGMANAEISVRPRSCDRYCPHSSVCRIEKWRLPLMLEEIKEEDKKLFSTRR